MLSGRATAEVAAGDQDRVRLELDLAVADPVVEQELAEAGPLDPLQELLRDDLVGVDVGAVEHAHVAFDDLYWLHVSPLLDPDIPGREAEEMAGISANPECRRTGPRSRRRRPSSG